MPEKRQYSVAVPLSIMAVVMSRPSARKHCPTVLPYLSVSRFLQVIVSPETSRLIAAVAAEPP